MTTVYKPGNPAHDVPHHGGGYTTYQEPDTRIPPKARPVFGEITVNGLAVPEADILAEAQHHPAANPGAAVAAAARALVVRELLRQEAERLGLETLAGEGSRGRRETSEEATTALLLEKEVTVPSASEEECRRFHQRNPARFRSPDIREVRHILLAAPETDKPARDKARAEAQRLIEHLKENVGDFGRLARSSSDCPSREQGGNLGQVAPGTTVPEFEAALQRLAQGEIGKEPVETRYGMHVVIVDRHIAGEALPFETVRDRIAAWLEARAWSRAVAQYISVLAGRADIRGIDMAAAPGPLVQ